MTELVCPHCGSSLAGVKSSPDGAAACPKCAKAVPPMKADTAAPASLLKLVEKPKTPWSTGPVKSIKGPWSTDPIDSADEPWSEESLDGEISLPFDPREESALEVPGGPPRSAVLWAFAGIVVFLAMLTGVVLLAHHLRPLVASRRGADPAVLQPYIWRLQVGSEESRQEAAGAIVAMGPDSLIATLELITTEDRANDKFLIVPGAVRALAGASDDAVEALGEALRSPKPNVRVGAASVLREMGVRGRDALQPLIAALADENRWVRWSAIESLGNLGSEAAGATAVLAGLIGDPEAYTRRRAIDALGHIGPAALEAAPTLMKAKEQDPDASVRRAAYVALRQIELAKISEESLLQADKEVQAIVTALQGEDDFAAVAAAKSLAEMGIQAKDAIPALALTLRHKDKWRREAAAKALGGLGLFASDFVPTLQVAAKDLEPEVRAAAEKALEEIDGKQLRR